MTTHGPAIHVNHAAGIRWESTTWPCVCGHRAGEHGFNPPHICYGRDFAKKVCQCNAWRYARERLEADFREIMEALT